MDECNFRLLVDQTFPNLQEVFVELGHDLTAHVSEHWICRKCETMALRIDGQELVVGQRHHLFDIIITQVEGVHDRAIECLIVVLDCHEAHIHGKKCRFISLHVS